MVDAQVAYNGDYTKEEWFALILNDIYLTVRENDETVDFEQLQEQLMYLKENPIRINNTTQAELEQLPFLTARQIDDILAYTDKRQVYNAQELFAISSLHSYDIRDIEPFVSFEIIQKQETIYWKEMLRQGKNEIDIRLDARSIERSGKDPYYGSLRYQFRSKKLQFGIVAERDPREPFYAQGKTYGADFYGGYAQLSDVGHIKRLVVGDFRTRFGMGLVINTSGGFQNKLSFLRGMSFIQDGINRKSSSMEYNFERGAGTTLTFGNVDISLLYSARKIDAAVGDNGTFTTIRTTGYHRDSAEIAAKRNVWQQIAGGNITYHFRRGKIGLTATENIFQDTLRPTLNYYNANFFRGKSQFSIGINYYYHFNRMEIFGEVATTQNSKWGVGNITGLRFSPMSDLRLEALYRYYSTHYFNLLANATGEDSHNNDEHGVLLGAEIDTEYDVRIKAYLDLWRFTLPKNGYKTASDGFEAQIIADYVGKKNTDMHLKFRAKKKFDKQQYGLQYTLDNTTGNWFFRSTLGGNIAKDTTITLGAMLAQDIKYSFEKVPIVLQFRLEAFYAKDYDNRFYLYENDVLYAFSVPALYGTGARYYLNFRYAINKHFTLYLKASQTFYSPNWTKDNKLPSSHSSDIHTMLRISL